MEFIGKITGLARRLNSPSGNPRWTVWLDGVPFQTGTDSAINYHISESWRDRQVKVKVSGSTLLEAAVV